MKKKIAIPVDMFGVLDAHFGHCKMFQVITVEGNQVVSAEKLVAPPHEPGLLPKFMAENGVTDILAGGLGQKAIQLLHKNSINVFVGAPQLKADELVEAFLKDDLEYTANYCDH